MTKEQIIFEIERWFAFYGEEFTTLEYARRYALFYGEQYLTDLFAQLDTAE